MTWMLRVILILLQKHSTKESYILIKTAKARLVISSYNSMSNY